MPLHGISGFPLSFARIRRLTANEKDFSLALEMTHVEDSRPSSWLSSAMANCASSRHSILRLWRGPSPRAYARGIISHGLSYRCDELCLFEALYPAPLARPFSKGLLEGLSYMDFYTAAASCASSRHSILRLWRGPSPRAYSRGIISHALLCRCSELCLFEALHPAPLARPFSKGLLAGGIF